MDKAYRIAVLVGIIVIAIICIYAVISFKTAFQGYDAGQKELLSRPIVDNNITKQGFREVNDKLVQVTEATSSYLTPKDLKKNRDEITKDMRDNLVGPIKDLTNATHLLAKEVRALNLALVDTVIGEDTLQAFKHKDDWLDMIGVVYPDRVDMKYTMRQGYRLEYHWGATGVFKPKELTLNVIAENPNVTVDKVKSFHIVTKKPLLERKGVNIAIGVILKTAFDQGMRSLQQR